MKTVYEHLKKLLSILSVSGAEETAAAYIAEAMRPVCDEVSLDAMGNLTCLKKSRTAEKTLLLSAHMDEIGFLVTDAQETGFLSLAPLGGQKAEACAYTRLRFENGTVGVLVPPMDTKPADLDAKDLLCDIGAKSKAEALRRVTIGMRAACIAPMVRLSAQRFSAKALDNKLGCALLIALAEALAAEQDLPYHLAFVFTVQEEVGARGAGPAAFALSPDFAINVDTTRAFDVPGAKGSVALGGGVCIKHKDRRVLCDRAMTRALTALAADKKIKNQPEILLMGGTDTGAIQASRAGVRVGAVSLPIRYLHTDAETADRRDVSAAFDLLFAACHTEF